MDIFAADHRISTSDDFPQNVSPFPDPTDLLYSNPSPVFHSSDILSHRPPLPPQKLRPIRCNGRSPVSSQAENLIFDGTLENCPVIASPEVGFTGDMNEYFDSSTKDDKVIENTSNCSTSDGGDDVASTEKPLNRKRKRRTTRTLELFMENLVMKVMDKQEQMHKQLIEMIEMKETERIEREEAWKQGEIKRIRRDEELRAQERTRSLAIISLMQNLLGQDIQISQPVENPCTEDDGGESSIQNVLKSDQSNKRWPQDEIQALITLRTALEHKFRASDSKGNIWEEISVGMHMMGHSRSAKKCKEKWENMNKYFKRTMGTRNTNVGNGKSCPYFQELDVLYSNGLGSRGATCGSTNTESDSKAENTV